MYLRRKIDIDVPKLISAVKKHECIWNVDNKGYKRRSRETARAWAAVAEEVGKKGICISDLRSKWKNIKDMYRKEIRKHYKDDEYQGQWQYFDELEFIKTSFNTSEKEKNEEPRSSDEESAEEQEIHHEGMVYKRKPDRLAVKLISEVREYECLWNKDYFPASMPSRWKSMSAWQKIAEKLRRPVNYVRTKWKNLKNSYYKEIQKNYFDGEYHGIWQYFNMMSFLKINFVEADDEQSEDEEPSVSSPENNASEESLQPENDNDISSQVKVEVEAIDNNLDYDQEFHQETLPAKKPRNDDEYDVMFLKSLVPFFRGMDPVRKLVLRSKIQDMVMKELTSPS